MNELYGFTAEQVERLRRWLHASEAGDTPPARREQRGRVRFTGTIRGFLDSEIAACASLTGAPVPGTLSVYSFTSTGSVDTGRNETVYNFAPQAATTDRWTQCSLDDTCGVYGIDTQYCT